MPPQINAELLDHIQEELNGEIRYRRSSDNNLNVDLTFIDLNS